VANGIRIDRLRHSYGRNGHEVTAVDDVSIDIAENEFYTLLGPSGCGKTTTLRCIAGLEQPDSGTIELGGTVVVSDRVSVPTYRRDIGMVFQDYAVWPHMSVFDNVAFPLQVGKRMPRSEIADRVEQALALVNMSQYIDRRATQLSGGQQQRLSLARALVRQPKVLLLDEPLSNLDAKLREQMRGELRLIQQSIGITTVFVTHDQLEALSLSTRIAVMKDGKVVQEGTPHDIYLHPQNEFVADFIGATTFVSGVAVATTKESLSVETPVGAFACAPDETITLGQDVIIAIRPEAITVSESGETGANTIQGQVELSLFGGEAVDYRVRAGDVLFRARGDARQQYAAGARVTLSVRAGDCVVLPASAVGGPLVEASAR
jgi:iron(III) transport system ATP-binding protein